ncbi:MAG TPA: division/cell wall cluster transcriptional repressor MraZ [Saprospiraceae bacterium]|nr:division/cell wall cluster transcriptional repressor MraZ [Saprospiraceae bacterium]HQW56851.1 division/cell wall cluster transcriptional repressor MraZ [Saprospiraceae bacterium]
MQPLYGEYECSIDEKGRLKLPSALLKNIPGFAPYKFVVNRGFEKCLALYPEKVWDEVLDKINNLNTFVATHRNFIRYFIRGMKNISTDNADRILLPKPLMEYGDIRKDVFLIGYRNHVEIWDKDSYNQFLEQEPENFSMLADQLLGGMVQDLPVGGGN